MASYVDCSSVQVEKSESGLEVGQSRAEWSRAEWSRAEKLKSRFLGKSRRARSRSAALQGRSRICSTLHSEEEEEDVMVCADNIMMLWCSVACSEQYDCCVEARVMLIPAIVKADEGPQSTIAKTGRKQATVPTVLLRAFWLVVQSNMRPLPWFWGIFDIFFAALCSFGAHKVVHLQASFKVHFGSSKYCRSQ